MHWIVLSDTHGNNRAILDILDAETSAAGLIHLGDLAEDMEQLASLTSLPRVQVAGNCDPPSLLPREVELSLGTSRLFLTHGHLYSVKGGLARLAAQALQKQCTFAIFGHSHYAAIETVQGVVMINPGTLQANASCLSYARLHVEQGGLRAELVTL